MSGGSKARQVVARCVEVEGGVGMAGMALETAYPRRVLVADERSLAEAGVAGGEMLNVVRQLQ